MRPEIIRNLTNVEFLDLIATDRFWASGCSAETLDAIKVKADRLARQLEIESERLMDLGESITDGLKELK